MEYTTGTGGKGREQNERKRKTKRREREILRIFFPASVFLLGER